uniref:Candidate secreted effector n=1 Tax=Meloidogyne incognita TaxID=6306 RepID=A0A914NR42_MELIC
MKNTKLFFSFLTTLFILLQLFICNKVESFDFEIRQFGPSVGGSNSGISQRSLFVDNTENNSEDNAGFLGNSLSVSGRRRLIQPPPLKRSFGGRGQRILVGNDWPILMSPSRA